MQKITPFLWFNDKAEEVAKFYTSISRIQRLGRSAATEKKDMRFTGGQREL